MSAVDFGYRRRPRGRHVPLPPPPATDDWRRRCVTPAERAARVYERLRELVHSVSPRDDVPVELRNDERVIVVCGDPECANDDGSGRWVQCRGRCPKCGGYAMTLEEVAKHRERVVGAR